MKNNTNIYSTVSQWLAAVFMLLMPSLLFSQAQLVFNGGTSKVVMVENGGSKATPIYIEINNPATDAIMQANANDSGYIQSESEFNMVKWDIGTTTGAYVVPFGKYNYYLPLTLNIGTAGNSGGSVLFSTWHTAADQNGQRPSDVTNLHAAWATGSPSNADNSYNVVDRFWVIDAGSSLNPNAYTTKPLPTNIQFSYISTGASQFKEQSAPNIFNEAKLLAQRFNSTTDNWGDWEGAAGTQISGTVGTVHTNSLTTNANFFRSWTLVSGDQPLPVQIINFTVQCINGQALLQWSSAVESNSSYYTIMRSGDGINFESIGTVAAKGNTITTTNYSFTDNAPLQGASFYQLYETDIDNIRSQVWPSDLIFQGCASTGGNITAYNGANNINVQITSETNDIYTLTLVNMLGQVIMNEQKSVTIGYNEIQLPNNVTPGIYLLNVRNEQTSYTRKLIIGMK
jgi:hypothetical protein